MLIAGLTAAALLSGCKTIGNPFAKTEPAAPAATGTLPAVKTTPEEATAAAPPLPDPRPEPQSEQAALPTLPAPATPPPPIPHIYLALQSDGEGSPVSAIFAIDAARNNTPSDDPAVRLTPENGLCNPHEMRKFTFPPQYAVKPVVSEIEQAQGLTAADLPAFMAVSVTDMMLARGLASDREQTSALNVCTRKLWEQLVLTQPGDALAAGAAGQ